jgi:hypothetical protein
MNEKKLILIVLLLVIPLCLWRISFIVDQSAAAAVINATIKMVICGNNIKEIGEDCDGTDLTNKNCQSFGYSQGNLSCRSSCDFNFTNCYREGENSGSSSGRYTPTPPETKIVLSGRAYPQSNVVLLKDGQIALKTIAGPDANFNMQLSGLSAGNYIFSVYGEDNKGLSSSSFVFPVKITQGATTNIGGIFIAPTITTDKNTVKLGDNIVIFGQSAPQSDITIVVNSENEILSKAKADKNGVYLYNFNTSVLEKGNHYAKSRATLNEEVGSYSKSIKFIVGDSSISLPSQKSSKGDLSNDSRVSLVDFSIAAYWYKKPLNQSFSIIEKEKLNGDGKIDLVDFSIIAFYWKG